MRRTLGLTAVLVVALAVAGFAQKPDFSGTWTPEPNPAAAAGGGGGGGGRGGGGPMTVKQSATELAIERNMGGNAVTTTYKLDGSETEVPAAAAPRRRPPSGTGASSSSPPRAIKAKRRRPGRWTAAS